MHPFFRRSACAAGIAAALCCCSASASEIAAGYLSYDVTGPSTAQFEVVNLTGPNGSSAGDPSFPIATPLPLSNLSLTVQYNTGATAVFGSSYFVLSTDGLSFDGKELSTLSGAPTGFFGATEATLSGSFGQNTLVLNDGTTVQIAPTFRIDLTDPAGLSDGDLVVFDASTVPEPASWLLLASGLLVLLLALGRAGAKQLRGGWGAAVGALLLMAGAASSQAATVKLNTATSPSTGAAGTTQVNVTGSGFPSGTIAPGSVSLQVASTCGGSGATTTAIAVQKVLGSTDKVEFQLPASLGTGTFYVSLSGTDSTGTAFNSGTSCSAVQVTAGPSPVLTIDTSVATDWKIANGALTIDFNPVGGNINGLRLGNSDNLLDLTNVNRYGPKGFYMDNSGFGTVTGVPGYVNTGSYIDWWVTYPSQGSTNAFTYSEHYVVTPNDPGFHVYFVANHAASDVAGSVGQVQWVFREDLNKFPNTFSVNADLSNPGPTAITVPVASEAFSTDPGRAVQDATVDLHGFTDLPANFRRSFYTKYDYSSYEYLHQAHGVYGSQYGAWVVLPSHESMVGGPTKQNLIFTGNLDIIEAYSSHLDNPISLTTPAGTASNRLFGPFYVRLNQFGGALQTPADMYQDALAAGTSFGHFYDNEQQLVGAGYVPSTSRGNVQVQITGVAGNPKTAWAVLSDPGKNFQLSTVGAQYWADISSTGSATFSGVIPGTYRLSVYALGKWGELRQDGVVVNAGQTTVVPTTGLAQENFGEAVFTIGTADRSSHEFLHGHDAQGFDDREYWGTWNYWADFQANQGAVVYNATSGPAGPATNNLQAWNYNHWQIFDPGLFGGVYNAGDDTTDGYVYAIPTYVKALPGATGTNGVSTRTPPWVVHFATPQDAGSYSYVVLSTALAAAEASYVINLNGQPLTWSRANQSDAAVRSGLSGYTQWVAFQWDRSLLNPPGQDNVLTLSVSATQGIEDDALRLELTNTTADPGVRGWNDYEYLYKTTDVKAADGQPNP